MASAWTHGIAAVTIAAALVPKAVPPRVWTITALAAILPDVDAIGRPFGAGDLGWLGGHRALTHSLVFAAVLGAALSVTFMRTVPGLPARLFLWLALALAIASHGALDSFTAYGEGIQFFAPFNKARYWAPWPLLGGGIVRDTIAFVLLFGLARTVIVRRGLPLPGLLNPRFLRTTV